MFRISEVIRQIMDRSDTNCFQKIDKSYFFSEIKAFSNIFVHDLEPSSSVELPYRHTYHFYAALAALWLWNITAIIVPEKKDRNVGLCRYSVKWEGETCILCDSEYGKQSLENSVFACSTFLAERISFRFSDKYIQDLMEIICTNRSFDDSTVRLSNVRVHINILLFIYALSHRMPFLLEDICTDYDETLCLAGKTDEVDTVIYDFCGGFLYDSYCVAKTISQQVKTEQAVVLSVGSELIAFYKSTNDSSLSDEEIVSLSELIPSTLMPKQFIRVTEFPYMTDGTINRKALSEYLTLTSVADRTLAERKQAEQIALQYFQEHLQGFNSLNFDFSKTFEEIGLNSLMFIDMVVDFEDQMSFEYPDEMLDALLFKTVGDFIHFICTCVDKSREQTHG